MTAASSLRQRNERAKATPAPAALEGIVVAVCTRAERSASMGKPRVPSLLLDPNRGVVRDLHSGAGDRQVTLIARADIDALSREVGVLDFGAMGENLVVDVSPSALVPGAHLIFPSGATIEGTRSRTPCLELEGIARGLLRSSVGRAGLFARVLVGGEVREGDTVRVE